MKLGYTFLPRWFADKSIYLYLAILAVVGVLFYTYSMKWYFILFGLIEVVGFFYFGNLLTKEWGANHIRSHIFEKRLFFTSFTIRTFYVLLSYWFYTYMNGNPFEFFSADAHFYHSAATYGAQLLQDDSIWNFWGNFNDYMGTNLSDTGYAAYLSFIYLFTGNSILLSRIVKALLSAATVLFIYRLSLRNFGETTARNAGIICMLMPNMIYYCGLQLKEVEMVFLTVWFVELADNMLRSRSFSAWQLIPVLLIGAMLFAFRTALAVVALLAVLFTLVLASDKVMSGAKRFIIGLLAISLITVTAGNRIQENARELIENVQSGGQKNNMQWRAQRDNGNKFAEYAGAVVFAPLIFTIPFPTMTDIPEQENQQMIHGGNFVKNVLSGLVILAMFQLLLSGDWRKYALPLSFMLGYLTVLVFSNFAQSERFHQPALPFELMFAAYGITLLGKREMRWFNYWLIGLFVVNLAWQWFKLAGRNML